MYNPNDPKWQLRPADAPLNHESFTQKASYFGVDEWSINVIIDVVSDFQESVRPQAYEAALKLLGTTLTATEIGKLLKADFNRIYF